jgi:hypothetical protein
MVMKEMCDHKRDGRAMTPSDIKFWSLRLRCGYPNAAEVETARDLPLVSSRVGNDPKNANR